MLSGLQNISSKLIVILAHWTDIRAKLSFAILILEMPHGNGGWEVGLFASLLRGFNYKPNGRIQKVLSTKYYDSRYFTFCQYAIDGQSRQKFHI